MPEPIVVTPPLDEPMSLQRARSYLKIDVPGYSGDTSSDADILSWIRGARQWVQREIDKSIGEQTLMLVGDSFQSMSRWGSCTEIVLPYGPVLSIESIAYIDTDGFDRVVDKASYKLTLVEPQRVVLKRGYSWPAVAEEVESVRIVYRAGFSVPGSVHTGPEAYADDYADDYSGTGDSPAGAAGRASEVYADDYADEYTGYSTDYGMPDDLLSAIRLIVAHLYRHRGAAVDLAMQELPLGVRALLWPNRASIGV